MRLALQLVMILRVHAGPTPTRRTDVRYEGTRSPVEDASSATDNTKCVLIPCVCMYIYKKMNISGTLAERRTNAVSQIGLLVVGVSA